MIILTFYGLPTVIILARIWIYLFYKRESGDWYKRKYSSNVLNILKLKFETKILPYMKDRWKSSKLLDLRGDASTSFFSTRVATRIFDGWMILTHDERMVRRRPISSSVDVLKSFRGRAHHGERKWTTIQNRRRWSDLKTITRGGVKRDGARLQGRATIDFYRRFRFKRWRGDDGIIPSGTFFFVRSARIDSCHKLLILETFTWISLSWRLIYFSIRIHIKIKWRN